MVVKDESCEEIAKVRRKLQKLSNKKINTSHTHAKAGSKEYEPSG
jgi:hypothetical protein